MRIALLALRRKIKARYSMHNIWRTPTNIWHWSSRWEWFAVLFLGGLAFIAMNEPYIGLGLLALALLSLSSKLWHAAAISSVWRVFGTGGIVIVAALCLMGTIAYMEDKPWSNLPVFWNMIDVIHKIPRSKYPDALLFLPTPQNWAEKLHFDTTVPVPPVNAHKPKPYVSVSIRPFVINGVFQVRVWNSSADKAWDNVAIKIRRSDQTNVLLYEDVGTIRAVSYTHLTLPTICSV